MSERKRCATCSKDIVGKGLCVEGSYFHPDCFFCDRCKTPLSGKFHKQPDGQRWCENCKPNSFCEACRKKIEGKETRSGGHVWHPACFKCETCQQPIVGTFARINGKLTCTECRDQVLSAQKDAAALKEVCPLDDLPICRGCKKPVQQHEARILADKRDMFHEECFKCSRCETPLEAYVILELREFSYKDCPYFCDRCAELERSKGEEHQTTVRNTCAVCGETCDEEEDAFQLLDGGILHWKCFKCSRCGRMEEKTSDSTQMALLRSKVCNAIKGKHYCATCNGSAEAPGDSCEAPSKGYPSPATVPEAPAASTPATAPVAVSAEPVESIPQAVLAPMTLQELQDPSIWKERGVEATSREQMLSDADFENTFGMTKENFGKLPAWKKGQKKREVGLF